jgi:hypothetical protein
MRSSTSIGFWTSIAGDPVKSLLRLEGPGIRAAPGRLSVEPPRDATERDVVLEGKPGRRGIEFGDSWNDFRGAGEYGLLGEPADGVDWPDWVEKRSNHISPLDVLSQ